MRSRTHKQVSKQTILVIDADKSGEETDDLGGGFNGYGMLFSFIYH
jgi:hypothetical protein